MCGFIFSGEHSVLHVQTIWLDMFTTSSTLLSVISPLFDKRSSVNTYPQKSTTSVDHYICVPARRTVSVQL